MWIKEETRSGVFDALELCSIGRQNALFIKSCLSHRATSRTIEVELMKFHTLPMGIVFALSLIVSAQAQGVPGGVVHGVSVGNQAAGPVGAVVGGVVGGVEGVLGIDPRPSYSNHSEEQTEYRHLRTRSGVRYSRHVIRHPSSYTR
jgi:hypothetical protein